MINICQLCFLDFSEKVLKHDDFDVSKEEGMAKGKIYRTQMKDSLKDNPILVNSKHPKFLFGINGIMQSKENDKSP